MKKLIALFILLIPIYSFSYENKGKGAKVEYSIVFPKEQGNLICSTDIGVWYTFFDRSLIQITPYGNTKTWFVQKGGDIVRGQPFLDVYSIGTQVRFKNVFFDTDHFCSHTVITDDSATNLMKDEKESKEHHKTFYNNTQITKSVLGGIAQSGRFNLYMAMGVVYETGSPYVVINPSYICGKRKWMFLTSGKADIWAYDNRLILTASETLIMPEASIKISYTKANEVYNRNIHDLYSEHLYDEYPFEKEYFIISASHTF